jgi:nicotinamidase-related amidase
MKPQMPERDETAGFGRALRPGKRPALLMIDFVQAYLDPASPLYADVEPARLMCIELLQFARERRLSVLHTGVEYSPGGADGGVFYRKLPLLKVFERGSPHGAFAPGLEPIDGEIVIMKQYASAFFGTSLASTLTAQGVDTVIIAGLTTSGCIRASTVDAVQHGFVPIVIEDAVGDRADAQHQANLFDMQAKYAEVMSLADLRDVLTPRI